MNTKTHTGTYAVIWRKDKVALVLKSKGAYVGKWDLPGGEIQKGEEIEEVLLQEINEKTGLNIKNHELVGVYCSRTKHDQTVDGSNEELFHIGIIFSVKVSPRAKIKSNYNEDSLGARWFTKEELAHLPLAPFAQKCIHI